jgi:hypothetical protein
MAKRLLLSLLLAAVAITARAQTHSSGRESIEWCDVWITHANETSLPRVLLLGDSIARGYYPEVEKRLAGKAFVNRLATSAFVTDPALLSQIAMVLDGTKFDVIHFNNGMHGWKHGEEEYGQGLAVMLETIRKHAPNARLIWASTTSLKQDTQPRSTTDTKPVESMGADAGKLMLKNDLNQVSDARINARNAMALRIMEAQHIPVDDLHALTLGHPDLHSDNVHFNKNGIDLQAAQVAAEIRKVLP